MLVQCAFKFWEKIRYVDTFANLSMFSNHCKVCGSIFFLSRCLLFGFQIEHDISPFSIFIAHICNFNSLIYQSWCTYFYLLFIRSLNNLIFSVDPYWHDYFDTFQMGIMH